MTNGKATDCTKKEEQDTFSIKFRGVRGSYPVANKDFLKYGGNTACVEIHAGKHLIILDAGTGLISLGNELMHKYIESGTTLSDRTPVRCSILLSHIHLDHIQGFTFFTPAHLASSKINVFGSSNYSDELADGLAEILFTKSFPVDLGDIAANLNISNITSNTSLSGCPKTPPNVPVVLLYAEADCTLPHGLFWMELRS